jgi:hypothetical protein
MKIYSRNEAIREMAQTAGVGHRGHQFECSATLDGYACSFRTNNEDWLYGIFDGRKYNLELSDPDFLADMKTEYGEGAENAIAAIAEDTANSNNYEPYSSRMYRIAERLLNGWEAGDNTAVLPENIIFSANGRHIFVFSDEELDLVNNDTRIYSAIWNDEVNTVKELLEETEN